MFIGCIGRRIRDVADEEKRNKALEPSHEGMASYSAESILG